MFTPDAFAFFADLAAHNDREWFAGNKARFETSVKAPFADLLGRIALRLEGTAIPYAGGADTMFRIHRDTRFAHDKSPYKTNVGGLLTPTGRKDMSTGMIYVHLDAAGCFCAAGVYQPEPARLAVLRDRMVADPDRYLAAIAGLTLSDEGTLTRMPRGYERHAEGPLAPHLRRKSLFVQYHVPMAACLDGSVADIVAAHALTAAPLLTWLR